MTLSHDTLAREVHIYGVKRALMGGHEWARQELCIGGQSCFQLDVPQAYLNASNDHDPVLLWSGSIANPFPQVSLSLRMTEPTHQRGQQKKWMSLDSIVCHGVYGNELLDSL